MTARDEYELLDATEHTVTMTGDDYDAAMDRIDTLTAEQIPVVGIRYCTVHHETTFRDWCSTVGRDEPCVLVDLFYREPS